MALIPESVMPHVRRFGWSGVAAVGIIVVMLAGINPITLISGKVSPPPPPTSITGLPPADATREALAAYPPIIAGETELMWQRAFRIASMQYPHSPMKIVNDRSQFGCGLAGKDLTVFYCSEDWTVYVDIDAYDRLRQSHPAGADYAMAYLVSASYGRNVQWALGALDKLPMLRARGDEAAITAYERQLDQQAACYAAMWTITAGIDELYGNPTVLAAIAQVDKNRQAALVALPEGRIVPETLATASHESRKFWYDAGYAIPAPGSCRLDKIAAKGLS